MKPLTIAIPTYNRNEILRDNLEVVLPQIRAAKNDVCLRIFDNRSDVPVEETLAPLLRDFSDVEIKIERNRANIGANANIMRCLELCDTPWMWMLGDDDTPRAYAVHSILEDIKAHPDALYLNYAFDSRRDKVFCTCGLDELFAQMDMSANLPWISSSVYRAEAMRGGLKYGYQYTYAMLSHVATLLMSVGEDGECWFLREGLILIPDAPPDAEQQWSHVNLALGAPIIYDLPLGSRWRNEAVRRLLVTNWGPSLSLKIVTYQLLLSLFQGGDRRDVLHIFDQVCHRGFRLGASSRQRAEIKVYRAILQHPKLAAAFYRLLKGKSLGGDVAHDRWERM